MTPRICVVGAANVDLISYLPRLPRMGETLHGSAFHLGYGGKGANQAVMAAKLGAQVSMVTKLGRDVFGDGTLENFRRWNVDTTYVSTTDAAFSGVAPIMVDPEGHNSIVIVTGAGDLLGADEVERAGPAITGAAVLAGQLELPVEPTLAAMRLARAAGVRTVLNPAPAQAELPAELFELSDVLCPNQGEAALLTGTSEGDPEAASRALIDRGARSVVVTLGERGALVVEDGAVVPVPGTPAAAVDTTGAGDAFVGALSYFLAAGCPLPVAAERAALIAGRSVRKRGTQTSFPDRSELPAELFDDPS
ncbi:MAG TPA: ribokinase [Mycobacteriales bacterium]|nr:ribokinase [Mycobacteriales bacterium]